MRTVQAQAARREVAYESVLLDARDLAQRLRVARIEQMRVARGKQRENAIIVHAAAGNLRFELENLLFAGSFLFFAAARWRAALATRAAATAAVAGAAAVRNGLGRVRITARKERNMSSMFELCDA
jgi:hypothetical protein